MSNIVVSAAAGDPLSRPACTGSPDQDAGGVVIPFPPHEAGCTPSNAASAARSVRHSIAASALALANQAHGRVLQLLR